MAIQPNLAVFYLLPLIELSISSFGDAGDINLKTGVLTLTLKSNLIDCYLSTESYIVVKVRDLLKVPESSLATHNYFSDLEITENGEKHTLILYRVDKPFLEDLAKFREGKYSKMREIAKDRIVIFNGWDHKSIKETSILYATLYKLPWLKSKLEDQLGISIPDDVELKSTPNEANFIDLSASFKEISTPTY